ncbi:MAG: DUF5687 family protein, partial [Bacteroidota bacterium]
GMFSTSYGQFLLGWDSSNFDAILTQNISALDYLRSKWLLFVVATTVLFILTLPYGFFGWHALLINFAAFCLNIGVNSFVIMYFATVNPKKIDLSKSNTFNWQGVSGTQFFMILPVLGGPLLVYLPFGALGYRELGLGVLAGIGLLGFAMSSFWLKRLAARLVRQKYAIAANFRQD